MNVHKVKYIGKVKDETSLYRILPFDRLVEIYKENQLTLISPNEWQDPFEKYWLRLINPAHSEKTKSVFGLCFSMQARSDALWRIYSPDMLGIRICIKAKSLKDQIDKSETEHTGKFILGSVSYPIKEKELIDTAIRIQKIDPKNITASEAAKAWLNKRRAFFHEKEIRLMYISHRSEYQNKKTIKFSIDPHKLISSIYVDPRASDELAEGIISTLSSLVHRKGEKRIPIRHSSLYKLPKALQEKKQ